MKELKLKQTVQGPIKRKQTFSLMFSLRLVQQYTWPENWPFFRSKTNDYTAQCLTHENAFLRLYVNDYNCNKSCPEMLSGICSPWLILCQSYLWIYVLGKGKNSNKSSNRTLTTLRYSFYLFSTTSWEIYKVPLKLLRQILFLPPSDIYIRSFLWSVTLHKALNDWNLSLVPKLTLLQRPLIWQNHSP